MSKLRDRECALIKIVTLRRDLSIMSDKIEAEDEDIVTKENCGVDWDNVNAADL